MAIRVTASEVREIMKNLSSTTTDLVIDTYIIPASGIIDKVFEGDTSIGPTLIKELERWLTAHLIASTIERMSNDEKLGEAEVKYIGKFGMKLESTPYGQNVLLFDITGKMGNLGTGNATMYAIKSFK